MDINHLVHMANQIGEFFEVMPDRQEAKDGLVLHIQKFWDPRMRVALLTQMQEAALPALSPLVREALTEQRKKLWPVTVPQA
jgi:formate dehydrogenase subunit delta